MYKTVVEYQIKLRFVTPTHALDTQSEVPSWELLATVKKLKRDLWEKNSLVSKLLAHFSLDTSLSAAWTQGC